MIANCSHDEKGNYHGGAAGDQGGEFVVRSWYSRPWRCVLHHPTASVRKLIAKIARQMADNNNIGYDQWQRLTLNRALAKVGWNPSKVTTKCETDCSASTTAAVKAAGHQLGIAKLANIDESTTTYNMRSRFSAAGFQVLTDQKYLSSASWIVEGDILLNDDHHVAINLTDGRYAASTATNPYAEPTTIQKKGSKGTGVKWVQWHLRRLGYSLGSYGIDGDFGSMTDKAVRAFQKKYGLVVDGQVGKNTRAKLKSV